MLGSLCSVLTGKSVDEVKASTPPELVSNGELRNYSNAED
jgi:hypothetical protein